MKQNSADSTAFTGDTPKISDDKIEVESSLLQFKFHNMLKYKQLLKDGLVQH